VGNVPDNVIVPPSEQGHTLHNAFKGPGILMAIDHGSLRCVLKVQGGGGWDFQVDQREDARPKVLDKRDDGGMTTKNRR